MTVAIASGVLERNRITWPEESSDRDQANPGIGRRVEAPEPHEVRRFLMGAYELRYVE